MQKSPAPKEKLLRRKVSFLFTLNVIAITVVIVILLSRIGLPENLEEHKAIQYISPAAESISMEQVFLTEYQFTRPLLLSDVNKESDNFKTLKSNLNRLIEHSKQNGTASSVSVYLRKLKNGEWIDINGREGYNPGSLLKVPVLITYLKQAEKNPELLEIEVLFDRMNVTIPAQTYGGKSIEQGKKYKVKDLLYYMAVHSDNYATTLLTQLMDRTPLVEKDAYQKFFSDLEIIKSDVYDRNLSITVSEYSKFMRILYSASYLNPKDSEYALSLLAQGDFKEGLLKQLPPDVKIAHKFGEYGTEAEKQLHETGIIYAGSDAYLLTIMTKGNDIKLLPEVLSEISKHVYDYMTGGKTNI